MSETASSDMPRRRALVISPVPTHPQHTANCARVLLLAEAMGRLGFEVEFAHVEFQAGNPADMKAHWGDRYHALPYSKPWRKHRVGAFAIPDRFSGYFIRKGMAYMPIDYHYDPALSRRVRDLAERLKPDVVLVHYVFFSAVLDELPGSPLKVLDTHDVFADRGKAFLKLGLAPEWFYTTAPEELKGLLRADRVLAITGHDRERLDQSIMGRAPIHVVGHPFVPLAAPAAKPSTAAGYFAADGAFNRDAAKWFLAEVWPEVSRRVPGARLKVFGGVAKGLAAAPGVDLVGRVPLVADAYRQCALMVNPMRSGTGLQTKTIESLMHGSAVAGTAIALSGLEEAAGLGAWRLDSAAEWIDRLSTLLTDHAAQHQAQLGALEFARAYHQRQMASLAAALQ